MEGSGTVKPIVDIFVEADRDLEKAINRAVVRAGNSNEQKKFISMSISHAHIPAVPGVWTAYWSVIVIATFEE